MTAPPIAPLQSSHTTPASIHASKLFAKSTTALPPLVVLALTNARNSLVAVLDADDRMLPTRLERQIAFFNENPGTSVICSFSYIIDAKGKRKGKSQNDVDASAGIAEQDPSRFLEVVHPSVIMVKEDVLALGGYNEALTRVVDRDLWGRLVTSGKQILCQREFLTDYRLHGSSMTMSSVLKPSMSCLPIDINVVRRLKDEPELSLEEAKHLLDRSGRKSEKRWSRGPGRSGILYAEDQPPRRLGPASFFSRSRRPSLPP